MENILEDQRRLHEERERLIDTQTKEILRKKATVSRRINFELFAHIPGFNLTTIFSRTESRLIQIT